MKTLRALLAKSTSWNRQGLYVRRGWRFGLGVGAPLFIGVATGLPVEGVTVCVGALLVGLTDSGDPYRRRIPQMLVASAWVGTCTFVGELVGAHAALTVLVLAIASFAAGICIAAGLTAYLIAVMGPLGMVFATGAPTSPLAALGHGALAALGGLIEVALVLMAWRSHPDASRTHRDRAAVPRDRQLVDRGRPLRRSGAGLPGAAAGPRGAGRRRRSTQPAAGRSWVHSRRCVR